MVVLGRELCKQNNIQVRSQSKAYMDTSVNDKNFNHCYPKEMKILTTMSLVLKGKAHQDDILPMTMAQQQGNPEAQQPSA